MNRKPEERNNNTDSDDENDYLYLFLYPATARPKSGGLASTNATSRCSHPVTPHEYAILLLLTVYSNKCPNRLSPFSLTPRKN